MVKMFSIANRQNVKEKTMRLLKITRSAVADFIETRARHAHEARQQARLDRELSRLPRYLREDVGFLVDQDR